MSKIYKVSYLYDEYDVETDITTLEEEVLAYFDDYEECCDAIKKNLSDINEGVFDTLVVVGIDSNCFIPEQYVTKKDITVFTFDYVNKVYVDTTSVDESVVNSYMRNFVSYSEF